MSGFKAVGGKEDHPAFTEYPLSCVNSGRILVVGAEAPENNAVRSALDMVDGHRFNFVQAASAKEGLCQLVSGDFDIAFIDARIGADEGGKLIKNAGGRLCPTPMVLVSDVSPSAAIDVQVPGGATDIVLKDEISPALLLRVIRYARFNHGTTRKLIVEENRAREIAAGASEANGQKSEFLAMMSHEFRTPLNAILGFSEAIEHEIFGELGGEGGQRYREYVKHIHSSGTHLLSLINDLLDLSKIEAGKQEIRPAEVGISGILADVVSMTRPQAENRDVTLDAEQALSADIGIFADRRLVTQAVLNIVANAVKFSPGGERVEVRAEIQGANAVITVTDRGCGIPPRELARVMEPFHQAGTLETRPGRGTGLGLPLSSSIMKLHQGGLEIASEEGRGTKVSVWMPKDIRTEKMA